MYRLKATINPTRPMSHHIKRAAQMEYDSHTHIWAGYHKERLTPTATGYAPKLSNKMFSAGTPRLSRRLTTDCAIIGGPHIR